MKGCKAADYPHEASVCEGQKLGVPNPPPGSAALGPGKTSLMFVSHIQVVMMAVPRHQRVMDQVLPSPWPRQAPAVFSRTKTHWRGVLARKETRANCWNRAAKNL